MSVLGDAARRARRLHVLSPRAGTRREEILEVALEVISRKGFHDTSIADIARGARASRATVYQYFHDKRDILLALAERVAKMWSTPWTRGCRCRTRPRTAPRIRGRSAINCAR